MWLTKIFLSSSGKCSDTAHRKAVRPVVVVERVHVRGVEVQVPSVRRTSTVRRATPRVPVRADIRQRTGGTVAIAGSGKPTRIAEIA